MQLQDNAFFQNWFWNKVDPYRSFETQVKQFESRLTQLESCLRDVGVEPLAYTWAMVTYVNHIPSAGQENFMHELGRIFRFWARDGDLERELHADFAAVRLSFPLPEPEGRLDVAVDPARLSEGDALVWRMELSASKVVPRGERGAVKVALKVLTRSW